MATASEIADLERNRAWVAAAVADGWSIEPTYGSEAVERAARLKRDGFQVQAIMRDNVEPHGRFISTHIHVWGPDGLAVSPGPTYDMERLRAGLVTCKRCKAKDVPTQRVGFAGRVCEACVTEARREVETPGWCN